MLRYRRYLKYVSVFLAVNMLYQLLYPLATYALTGGPSQPEVQSFEPAGTTDMVDLFTGKFNYNIPLLDVDGYPINISYNSTITMDQEASWTGLGWNVNPGVVQRDMRGLPDDFDGEQVVKQYNIKGDTTYGITGSTGFKIASFPVNFGISLGLFDDNYDGLGTTFGINAGVSAGILGKGSLTMGLGLNFNSQQGPTVSPSIGLSCKIAEGDNYNVDPTMSVGACYSSRTGLKGLNTNVGGLSYGILSIDKSSFISFAQPTYIPTITMPLANYCFTLNATVGGAAWMTHPNVTITGYGSAEFLQSSTVSEPAYGYLYSDAGRNDINGLLDFNREKDVPFIDSIQNLPIANFTYDLFSVSGQGTEGQYRAYRGDVGELFDPVAYNNSLSASAGVELGVPLLLHGGIDITQASVNTVTGQWNGNNSIAQNIAFKSNDDVSLYEPYYFKNVGEKTINDNAYYSNIDDTDLLAVQLNRSGSTVTAESVFNVFDPIGSVNIATKPVNQQLTKTRREKRNQSFSFLNGREATTFGLDKKILSYPMNTIVYSNCSNFSQIKCHSRIGYDYQKHQMSEITIVNPDGKRYIYGIPAYNTLQKEVSFSVNRTKASLTNQLVSYTPGVDNSTSNSLGNDNYYDGEQIPAYAHSFLLTGVLSPDYVDLTGNGITDDDLGQAVKINYAEADSDYQWRIPYGQDTASYQEIFKADAGEDRGNYLYGVKQLWYVHSIESKTMVAQFYMSPRNDGYGVQNENGGWGANSRPSMKLDSIALFSKADLLQHGANALPIKVVHFIYDYSLCNNIDNFNADSIASYNDRGLPHGKLTLKKIYFTYQGNTEGKLNSYQFCYCNNNSLYNPNYNQKEYDRWGCYDDSTLSGLPLPAEFPYTVQNKTIADTFSRAWKLSSIVLPSGGQINISYESDDYAYVQNQPANQMIQVQGASATPMGTIDSVLYTGASMDDVSGANYFLRLALPAKAKDKSDFFNKYLNGIDEGSSQLYFKFLVDVDGKGNYDYVPGYTNISDYGLIDSTHAWLLLTPDPYGMNPITRAASQFVRLNIPKLAYPYMVNTHAGFKAFLYSLLGEVSAIGELIIPYENHARSNYYGQHFSPRHSWIRLDNPTHIKFGGGARVSKITISDNWANMVNGYPTATYGQTYSYTMTSSGQTISSGVASYEPFIGGDENPLKQPLPYSQINLLAPNNNLYTETPLGEALYPAPIVGYRQVTVQNLQHPDIQRTATGYTINTFYTAYDFPTLNSWTPLSSGEEHVTTNMAEKLLNLNIHDYMTASQGFIVETNDMHGKPSGQYTFDANGSELASTNYYYKTDNPNHLNNDVSVVEPSGSITTASVGKDIDMWVDMRQQQTDDESNTITPDVDGFLAALFPVVFPTAFNFLNSEHTSFRSAGVVKYIHRSGILDSVVTMEYGSTVTTKNLLFDGETGEVLLTQTSNEYDAPIYNFTYPALWTYSGMAPAYNNIGATINVTLHKGKIKYPTDAASFFTTGDQVDCLVNGQSLGNPYWIIKPQDSLVVIDDTGRVIRQNPPTNMSAFSGNCTLKVIRSGHRNMGSVPIGSIVSMNLPEQGDSLKLPSSPEIVQANATLYSDQWQTNCNAVQQLHCMDSLPYFNTCYKDFMINLLTYHVFYFNADSGITENCFIDSCNGTPTIPNFLPFGQNYHAPVYSISAQPGEDMASSYEMQVGKCELDVTSLNGKLLYLDSLHLNNNFTSGGGHNSTTGCDTLYYNYQILSADSISASPDTLRWSNPPPPGGWIPLPFEGGGSSPDDTRFHGGLSSLPPPSAYQVPVALSCWDCSKCDTVCESLAVNNTTNPYAIGLKGNWRPYKGYVYYGDRTATASASSSINTNILQDGVFKTFNPIWKYSNSLQSFVIDTSDANWVWDNSVTQYNAKGSEVENKDALGIYSSSLFGYIDALQTATATDAKYKDIAFDNFEDYGFVNSCQNPCIASHWNFINSLGSGVDTTSAYAHSGRYSLCLLPGHSASVTRSINYYPDSLFRTTDTSYVLNNGGCIYQFSPDSGSYILDAWVKEGAQCPVYSYSLDTIKVTFSGTSKSYKFMPSGPVISGWQRYQSKFNVPDAATGITVTLQTASSDTAYFDDIRIHPYESMMTSYVYDPVSLRMMAELDQNNYATFYQYDDEGTLVRVNKETERGILTLQENRSTYYRK